MITRHLFTTLAFAATAAAEPAGLAGLDITAPDQWVRSVDPETHLLSLSPPGGNAALTFSASEAFTGTAEQWLHKSWTGVLEEMKLTGPSVPGRTGEFLTRMGECIQPDGSKPMIALFALVKNGRGESAIFFGANQATFFEHMPAVYRVMRGIKIAPPVGAQSTSLSPMPPLATEAVPPVLAYDEPAGYYRGAGQSPIEYSSSEVNSTVQVYDFRPFTGDIATTFRTTLLRDWIDPRFREGPLTGPPQISDSRVPGATLAMSARFHENIAGLPNERMRMLTVVGNMAAVIDIEANSNYSWQKAGPAMLPMLNSIRVERTSATPSAVQAPSSAPPSVAQGPSTEGATMAGLFMGMTQKYSAIIHMSQLALYYYAFSPDGRVFRCYDFPPGGNDNAWRNFDYNAAQRTDPVNTGRYSVRGNQLFIQMGSGSFTGTIRDSNNVTIQGVAYERQP